MSQRLIIIHCPHTGATYQGFRLGSRTASQSLLTCNYHNTPCMSVHLSAHPTQQELEFDIEAYIQWRAKEEGVVVDPVAVRTFGDAASVAGSAKETKEANPMESVTSAALKEQLDDEPTLGKMGVVQKKGSGVGLFASSKWKKKLLCVIGGGCMYFDDAQLSAKSTCSRFLDLVGAYAESVSDEKNPSDAPFAFRVVAPARTFIFACESQEELDAWLSVIAREIQVGTDNHAARTGGGGSGGAKTGEAADGAGAVAPKKVVAL